MSYIPEKEDEHVKKELTTTLNAKEYAHMIKEVCKTFFASSVYPYYKGFTMCEISDAMIANCNGTDEFKRAVEDESLKNVEDSTELIDVIMHLLKM